MNNLEDILRNIVNQISVEIEKINAGGCGWFCLFLSKKLEELKIDYDLVIINSDSFRNIYLVSKLKDSDYSDNLAARHYMLKVGKYYIDGNNLCKSLPNTYKYDSYMIIPTNYKTIQKICYSGEWNPTFKIRNLKYIKKIIRNNFKNYGL